jgi:hypothetical protein
MASGMRGNPRLVLAVGGQVLIDPSDDSAAETSYLLKAVHTTIGSGPDEHIVLDGLQPQHAVVDWLAVEDEFVFRSLVDDGSATVDGKPQATGLHHGDRVQVGPHTLIFQRDEDADHIRVDTSREGGGYTGTGRHRPGGHEGELG